MHIIAGFVIALAVYLGRSPAASVSYSTPPVAPIQTASVGVEPERSAPVTSDGSTTVILLRCI